MFRFWFLIFLLPAFSWSQVKTDKKISDKNLSSEISKTTKDAVSTDNAFRSATGFDTLSMQRNRVNVPDSIATIDMYIKQDINGRQSQFDTILSLKKHYEFNYHRKDNFGLLSFNNDGQAYMTLNHSLNAINAMPGMGFQARNFAYKSIEDIQYYHVPTAASEILYRTAVKQGQNLDALITMNTSKQLNFFVGYRGLRSLGNFINQLSSVGNFQIGSSYDSRNKKYFLRTHITVQDILNQENGGITDPYYFEANEGNYSNREQLNVFMRDAQSFHKGIRVFADQRFNFFEYKENDIWIKHQFVYEYRNNLFQQGNSNPNNFFLNPEGEATSQQQINHYFGQAYSSSIYDKVRHKNLFNKMSLSYANETLGDLSAHISHLHYDYFYKSLVYNEEGQISIPSNLTENIVTFGGTYIFDRKKFDARLYANQAIVGPTLTELKAEIALKPLENIELGATYEFVSAIPDLTKQLFQSHYVNYNWHHLFSNEKHSRLQAHAKTPWVNAQFNYHLITDKIFFSNDSTAVDSYNRIQQQIISPKQHSGVINYLSLQLNREFTFGKFALDNTLLYQVVAQEQDILNVPAFTTRNTIYYSDYWFKRALFLQTGITLNYFTKYYADGYNPIVGDFYVQNHQKIGNFPMFDFFINVKIRTARIYLQLEHFNAKLTGTRYYTAPNYPVREFTFRFGLVWNFFN